MSDAAASCSKCQRAMDPKQAASWFKKDDGSTDPFADELFLCPGCQQKLGSDAKPQWKSLQPTA